MPTYTYPLALALTCALALTAQASTTKLRTEQGRATRFADPGDKWRGGKSPCLGRRVEHTDWGVAHRSLPCGTMVTVTNHRTGLTVVAPVVTRGPYGACLDVGWTRGPCEAWAIKRRAGDAGVWRGVVDLTPPVFAALAAKSFDRVTLTAAR
jgi:hypothetical protein